MQKRERERELVHALKEPIRNKRANRIVKEGVKKRKNRM
jgi:hypothetical protein